MRYSRLRKLHCSSQPSGCSFHLLIHVLWSVIVGNCCRLCFFVYTYQMTWDFMISQYYCLARQFMGVHSHRWSKESDPASVLLQCYYHCSYLNQQFQNKYSLPGMWLPSFDWAWCWFLVSSAHNKFAVNRNKILFFVLQTEKICILISKVAWAQYFFNNRELKQ